MNNLKIAKEFIEGTKDLENGGTEYGEYGALRTPLRIKVRSLAKGYIVISEYIEGKIKELNGKLEDLEHRIWFIDMADKWTHDDYERMAKLEKERNQIREEIAALENAISPGDNENEQ